MANYTIIKNREVLSFSDAFQQKGLHITFRSSDKYSKILFPGQNILLVDIAGTPFGKAKCLFTEVIALDDVEEDSIEFLLKYHTDKKVKTYDDLINHLTEVYEDSLEKIITAVGFIVE